MLLDDAFKHVTHATTFLLSALLQVLSQVLTELRAGCYARHHDVYYLLLLGHKSMAPNGAIDKLLLL